MSAYPRETLAAWKQEMVDNPHPVPAVCLNPRCDAVVQTCELGECSLPGHENGCQVEGGWVCSEKCWDIVTAEESQPMSDRDATPTPETELLHWGREEEFDNPTGLFEVSFEGDLRYWVSAEDAADALMLVKTNGEDDHLMGETIHSDYAVEVKSLSLAEANVLTFYGDGSPASTIAAEYNRDPNPRVIACSEWVP